MLLGKPPDIPIAGVVGEPEVAQTYKCDGYVPVPAGLPETYLEVSCVAFNIMIEEDGYLHALAARPVAFGRAPGALAPLFLRLTGAEGVSCAHGRAVRSALGALQNAAQFPRSGVRVRLDALRDTARLYAVAHQRGESPA